VRAHTPTATRTRLVAGRGHDVAHRIVVIRYVGRRAMEVEPSGFSTSTSAFVSAAGKITTLRSVNVRCSASRLGHAPGQAPAVGETARCDANARPLRQTQGSSQQFLPRPGPEILFILLTLLI
jgi:hypothetical protein